MSDKVSLARQPWRDAMSLAARQPWRALKAWRDKVKLDRDKVKLEDEAPPSPSPTPVKRDRERAELGAMAPCEACGAEVFADYRHFCLRCGLRLPLTPSSPSPKPAAEMVINKKPASKVIKKPKTKTAKKRAR